MKLLLKDERVDPSADSNYAIQWTCSNGHVEIVKLLLADERVDPSAGNNYAIREACENGHVEVVKMLLADERVDPRADNNFAIRTACINGHVEIVKLLLPDERVDPSAYINYAIRWACANGHVEVVKMLLADERVDREAIQNNKFIFALLEKKENRVSAIEEVMKTVRLDWEDNWLFRICCRNGFVDIVEHLLSHYHDKVDPAARDDQAIQKASANGHHEIVKILLEDGRADPGDNEDDDEVDVELIPVVISSKNGHIKVVMELLKDSRVDSSCWGFEALSMGY